jgi:hypothetical protein
MPPSLDDDLAHLDAVLARAAEEATGILESSPVMVSA